jgi:hypothetical protein
MQRFLVYLGNSLNYWNHFNIFSSYLRTYISLWFCPPASVQMGKYIHTCQVPLAEKDVSVSVEAESVCYVGLWESVGNPGVLGSVITFAKFPSLDQLTLHKSAQPSGMPWCLPQSSSNTDGTYSWRNWEIIPFPENTQSTPTIYDYPPFETVPGFYMQLMVTKGGETFSLMVSPLAPLKPCFC